VVGIHDYKMGVMDEEYFYVAKTELPPLEQARADRQAMDLQISFLTRWVVKANLDLYKTDVEKDWANVVRKDLRYINGKALGTGLAHALLLSFFYSSFLQKISVVPLVLTPVFWYWSYYPLLDQNTRRLFSMLNIGTEYELGAERNRVLEQCNEITRRADF